jgi:hypothetical protein
MPALRRVLAALTSESVPDLGPAAAMDQLTVLVYDACAAGLSNGLESRLAALRRDLT